MTDLTLHYAIPSRGFVTHWLLEELGQPFERRILDFDKEEQKTPEFLALNPMGKVPVLVHGDRVVTETNAICLYLAEQFPAAGLNVPVDSPLRGDFLKWMFFSPATIEPALVGAAFGFTAKDYEPFPKVETVADVLRQAVAGREFVVGDTFTAADVVIGSALNWGLTLMPVLPKHPEFLEYWGRLQQRPAWQAVLATFPAAAG